MDVQTKHGDSAVISECGGYRYFLSRTVDRRNHFGKVYGFIGINPSTADAFDPDATVNKWTGFTKEYHGREFVVANLFAFRAKDVKKLKTADDPVGPENDAYINYVIRISDIIVPCWGRLDKVPRALRGRIDVVNGLLLSQQKPVRCSGRTKCGQPGHPLMLPYSTKLQDYF